MRWRVAIAVCIVVTALGCGGGSRQAEPVVPVVPTAAPAEPPAWALPEGWRAETIPFPLGFAPSLPYRGVEELRFPAEFFTVGHEDYFAYAFVWHIAAPGPAGAGALERDLVAYFEGLARAVGGEGRADIAAFETRAVLSGDLSRGVSGTVDAFDAFKAQAPVRLHLKVWSVPCATPERVALVFVAAPGAGAAWQRAEALGRAFGCPGGGNAE
jgi:hypothetical protein